MTENAGKTLLVLLFVLVSVSYCQAEESPFLFQADFNEIKSVESLGFTFSGNKHAEIIVSGEAVLDSGYLKITLDRMKNSVPYRTELQPNKLPEPYFEKWQFAKIGQEYWYAVRIYLPPDWQFDKYPEIIMQWHSAPDLDSDEQWRNPPLALVIGNGRAGEGKSYLLNVRADYKRVTLKINNGWQYSFNKSYDLGLIEGDLGKWTDWIFNIRWSFKGDGFINIWKDGEFFFSKRNISNAYNDRYGPYFKFGIYKWAWNPDDPGYVSPYEINSRTIYFDDLRIGVGEITLKDFLLNNAAAK